MIGSNNLYIDEANNQVEDSGDAIPVKIINHDRDSEKEIVSDDKECSEYEECIDLLQRTRAEFINYKRRIEHERLHMANEGCKNLINALLPVLDDFDYFFAHHPGNGEEVTAGIALISEKLVSTLKGAGLQRFGQRGEQFDPEIHEAVMVEEIETAADGTILEVWQPGYFFHDKLLRAARVKVASNSTLAGEE